MTSFRRVFLNQSPWFMMSKKSMSFSSIFYGSTPQTGGLNTTSLLQTDELPIWQTRQAGGPRQVPTRTGQPPRLYFFGRLGYWSVYRLLKCRLRKLRVGDRTHLKNICRQFSILRKIFNQFEALLVWISIYRHFDLTSMSHIDFVHAKKMWK